MFLATLYFVPMKMFSGQFFTKAKLMTMTKIMFLCVVVICNSSNKAIHVKETKIPLCSYYAELQLTCW